MPHVVVCGPANDAPGRIAGHVRNEPKQQTQVAAHQQEGRYKVARGWPPATAKSAMQAAAPDSVADGLRFLDNGRPSSVREAFEHP